MFPDELRAMYQSLRSTGALSYDKIEEAFESHQAKWPEAVFNEDAWFKYLAPLEEKGSAAYLAMLLGSKAEQRKWWLYNRFRYIDSKYNAGDSLTDVITLRGYAKSDITITPYADVYATVKYGSYLVQTRAQRNKSYVMECPLDNVNDTEIYIYSASQLADVGDLSALRVAYCTALTSVSAPELQTLPSQMFLYCQALEKVVFPKVSTVNSGVFNYCTNLTKIDLGGAITRLGSAFMSYANKVTALILRGVTTVPTLGSTTFNSTPVKTGTCYVYVPKELEATFKVASNWSAYASQIRAIEDYPDICGQEVL